MIQIHEEKRGKSVDNKACSFYINGLVFDNYGYDLQGLFLVEDQIDGLLRTRSFVFVLFFCFSFQLQEPFK